MWRDEGSKEVMTESQESQLPEGVLEGRAHVGFRARWQCCFPTEWWLQQVFSEMGILEPAHLGGMHLSDSTTKGFLKYIWNFKSLLYFKTYPLQRAFSYSFMGFVV